MALVPLTFFAPQLFQARLAGLFRYGRFASRYTNAFQDKWLGKSGGKGEPLLCTSDIQSLADLANSYDVVRRMRLLPFDQGVVFGLVLTVALPLAPLVLTMIPL